MEMMRHVGKVMNTDQRCVVAYMQIPGRPTHALIVPTDPLPPRFEQAVMDIVKSAEGQSVEILAEALARRLMPDTGKDIFTTLHEGGWLQAVETKRIMMMPRPNYAIRLDQLLEQIEEYKSGNPNADRLEKFNPHTNNIRAEDVEKNRAVANNLILEAQMLEAEARKKREKAYAYDATLRPVEAPKVQAMPEATRIDDPSQLSLDELLRED